MIYSVWQPAAKRYDYYETDAKDAEFFEAPQPRHRDSGTGISVERAAWILPHGARKVGSGPVARGVIAQTASQRLAGMSGFDPIKEIPLMPLLALFAVAYIYRKEFV